MYYIILFIHSSTKRLLPPFGYCEQGCWEYGYTNFFSSTCFQFLRVCTQKRNCWITWSFCLIFWGPATLFSMAATPCSRPTSSVQRFWFLLILTNTCSVLFLPFFDSSHPHGCEVLFVILIYISLMISDNWASFHMPSALFLLPSLPAPPPPPPLPPPFCVSPLENSLFKSLPTF